MTIPPTVRVMPRDQNMKRSILRCKLDKSLIHLLETFVDLLKAPVHLSLKLFKTFVDLFETSFDHLKLEIYLLKALIHLLDQLLNQFSLVFKCFFHPYHAFAQLNLIDSWWLAQADLSEPFAEVLR